MHTHSSRSDGTDQPRELVAAARAAGIDVLGITDHDTTSGWNEARTALDEISPNEPPLTLVCGMEFTTTYAGISVHLLGYLFDAEHPGIAGHIERLAQARARRAQQIVEALSADYPIAWEGVVEHAPDAQTVGRPHIADALVSLGIVPNRSAAFATLLNHNGPYYVPTPSPSTIEAISWIIDAGGKAVLAHPKAASRGNSLPDEAIVDLADAGLFGVELWHRDNPEPERENLSKLIGRLGLRTFGASDYHGMGKPNRLGENTTPESVYRELIDGTYMEVFPR
ncbi:MAG: PHP domain-containing protein [Actinomycetaceae bacterium]|nr:PHP domain-containing protein [Arcanobacterium sp.]MDD7504357.1 PHP domain-containing protein [Actinomycetaceae bacterium]MDY6143021.1 PHP domain-containing protein [Arcanobacterium sp.]